MHSFEELNTYLEERTAQEQFAGVVLITQGDHQRFAGAYGYASRAWKIPNTLTTRFDTASITKLFTAVATLQLIDQGRLRFDTSAIDLLGLEGTAISRAVTVYHLLTHSSGIADDADEEAGESYEAVWQTRPNYTVTATKDFLPQFAYKPANFPPGQGCRYCNCGYVLLGLLIEQASGLRYRDYVQQHIFAPVGMNHSAFLRKDEVHEQVAEGADPITDAAGQISGWRKNIYSFPPIGSPDGGAYVTASDLDRFLRAVQAGQLLSPTLTTAWLTPQLFYRTGKQWAVHYGYGLVFYLDDAGRVVSYHKEGINTGVSGIIRHFPAHELNVVLLSTLSEGVWEPINKIHAWIASW
ncbi:MAG: beta-lactamase family protein [Caldilineaceae bacterium]|nr:beta-lactamase family protein [Caldilineaceae bacterium]